MNRIKELRFSTGIKQTDLAKAIAVSQAALSGYETGKYEPDFQTATKLANYFSVTVDYLMGLDTKKDLVKVYGDRPDILIKFDSLSPDDQDEVLAIIEMKLAKQSYEKRAR